MCNRMSFRLGLFLVLFLAIWAAAAWVDVSARPHEAAWDAVVAATDGDDAADRLRAGETAHNAIAAMAALLLVAAFFLTIGGYRRPRGVAVRTQGSVGGGAGDGCECGPARPLAPTIRGDARVIDSRSGRLVREADRRRAAPDRVGHAADSGAAPAGVSPADRDRSRAKGVESDARHVGHGRCHTTVPTAR